MVAERARKVEKGSSNRGLDWLGVDFRWECQLWSKREAQWFLHMPQMSSGIGSKEEGIFLA